ncbi:DUF1501 domain-containing protein [Stenotrophomonas maltophilia]|uniref:DUF1501 domain-containing protein n=2 Tax=Lysobacteraceae TaxID=32033 RepID=UPI001312F563|nr:MULTISPECIES: DUF1501 domain-containing protein [Stenotrophomonas]EME3308204.1 DUF1501 domain-containing protein [Pseudomonas aeruginosa]EKU9958491.1 DUF1501 domain-containing protein [Stenotrophomonas maltophilia]EKU9984510.1 DUF1501 domain-containing protein [Stenotrophomonas maltophilia]MBA0379956.1 DUF1501 domain-containing protein [Stenotrophomonas maltophilia]MBA0408683.1 DUF1501 domain-containing protein [Stenotrophomonas maltophilia]
MTLTRRMFLGAAGAVTTLTLWPWQGQARTAGDTRLLVVLLRGGLDGLHTLIPRDDPQYRSLRGSLVPDDAPALDGSFALHPSLSFAHDLYRRKQLLPVVAVAPPYQERSHFDAQNCLENGTGRPSGAGTGWLNRCAGAMADGEALAIGSVMPLIMRGPGDAATWSPPLPEDVNPILLQRLEPLYSHDAALSASFSRAMATQGTVAGVGGRAARMVAATTAAGRFMAKADGPRIGFVEDSGWDTHANEAAILKNKLSELDVGLRAFHEAAQPIWDRTVVVVVSEFGRTAKVNGSGGTDHGTGGLALLAGGAVRGGHIAGQWPGLAPGDLNEGRDVRVTTDMRALFKGVLAGHLRLDMRTLDTAVFPDSGKVRPMDGLLV